MDVDEIMKKKGPWKLEDTTSEWKKNNLVDIKKDLVHGNLKVLMNHMNIKSIMGYLFLKKILLKNKLS